jgi:hypothetical protein
MTALKIAWFFFSVIAITLFLIQFVLFPVAHGSLGFNEISDYTRPVYLMQILLTATYFITKTKKESEEKKEEPDRIIDLD